MFHMRFAQAFQSGRCDAVCKPQKPRLHVGRKGGDLSGDSFVEDFHSPGHSRLYLNFEIEKRGK
jgi:general stress protein YciG